MSFRIYISSLSTYNHLFVLPINNRVCFMARVKDHAACTEVVFCLDSSLVYSQSTNCILESR